MTTPSPSPSAPLALLPSTPQTPLSSAPQNPLSSAQTTPTNATAGVPAPSASRVRGSSFTTRKDEALTKAWIRVSEEAVIGADQKGDVFYKAIDEYYETIQPQTSPKRKLKSIESRVKTIISETLSLVGCVAKVIKTQPSGTTSAEVVHLATAIFKRMKITWDADDCGQT